MERILKFISKYATYRKAGIELNLITLRINDKEVMDDFNKEKIYKQNQPIFWINMATILYNLAFNYTDFLSGSTISSFQSIRGYSTIINRL